MYTVYYIKSIATNALLYVGLTKAFSNRKSCHRASLRGGKHYIKGLQSHVDEYGLNDLDFLIYNTYDSKIAGKQMEFLAIRGWRPAFNTIWNKADLPQGINKLEFKI